MPPLEFSWLVGLVGRPDLRFEDLSQPTAIYWIIFELNPFKFKFELWVHKLLFRKFGENTSRFPEGVGPQNQSQTWFHHPLSKNGGRREFDLDLKFSQMWFKKILKKMENLCMESWYVIWYLAKIPNMAFQGFIEKLFTKNGTKQDSTWLST
jgi:hypothetical protein